jgi:hypothetical protein
VQGLGEYQGRQEASHRSSSREHTAGSGLDRPLAGKIADQNSIFGKIMTDLNSLIVFAYVVEANSFSGAARILKMPTSTVSRRIAELEDQLGVRLIDDPRGDCG